MLSVYVVRDGRIVSETPPSDRPLPAAPLWIDAFNMTTEEEAAIETLTGIDVPTPEEMREIETTSRLYREGNALVMTASILNRADTPEPETRAITFILAGATLITLRYCEPQPFRTFPARLRSQPELAESAETTLVGLLDAIIDRIADTLESVDMRVSEMSKSIFGPLEEDVPRTRDYRKELKTIGTNSIRCSRVDESLVGLSRLLIFLDVNLRQSGQKQIRTRIKDLQRDINSLAGYVERLSEKLELLLEATLGMISIQQNAIIKIFSVVAVVFLPPTLIASIYGMNFELMPELKWTAGYPFALTMMVASAVLPYLFFKRKGWL
jgi:magnesium transporter